MTEAKTLRDVRELIQDDLITFLDDKFPGMSGELEHAKNCCCEIVVQRFNEFIKNSEGRNLRADGSFELGYTVVRPEL